MRSGVGWDRGVFYCSLESEWKAEDPTVWGTVSIVLSIGDTVQKNKEDSSKEEGAEDEVGWRGIDEGLEEKVI